MHPWNRWMLKTWVMGAVKGTELSWLRLFNYSPACWVSFPLVGKSRASTSTYPKRGKINFSVFWKKQSPLLAGATQEEFMKVEMFEHCGFALCVWSWEWLSLCLCFQPCDEQQSPDFQAIPAALQGTWGSSQSHKGYSLHCVAPQCLQGEHTVFVPVTWVHCARGLQWHCLPDSGIPLRT